MINLHGSLPEKGRFIDEQELIFLRRANLDMFWSQESGTVKGIVFYLKDITLNVLPGGGGLSPCRSQPHGM